MPWYIGLLIGFIGAVGVGLWGILIHSVAKEVKLNINIPDLNASALVNSFKEPSVLLTLLNMIFVVVTQVFHVEGLSIGDYMAVAGPIIALITGKAVVTATTNKATNGTKNNTGGSTT